MQVFEDIKFTKIDKKMLEKESKPLGEGGFGAVYKATYLTVTNLHECKQSEVHETLQHKLHNA